MEVFSKFFESYSGTPTVEDVYRGLGIELSDKELQRILAFPLLFDHKLAVRQVHMNPQYKETNEIVMRKLFSLTAACLGYGTSQGLKMPKTKLFLKYARSDEDTPAGYHTHHRQRSWSHEIELFFNHISNIEELISYLSHEMGHGVQTSQRSFKIDQTYDYNAPDYGDLPWEVDANAKSEEAVEYVMQYIKFGTVKGFDPRKV